MIVGCVVKYYHEQVRTVLDSFGIASDFPTCLSVRFFPHFHRADSRGYPFHFDFTGSFDSTPNPKQQKKSFFFIRTAFSVFFVHFF